METVGQVISKNGKVIRLTTERWFHIVESHDYMAGNQDLVLETIEIPDMMTKGRKGEIIALKHYKETSISEKHIVVIYKETDIEGFVITAFMTSKPQKIVKRGIK